MVHGPTGGYRQTLDSEGSVHYHQDPSEPIMKYEGMNDAALTSTFSPKPVTPPGDFGYTHVTTGGVTGSINTVREFHTGANRDSDLGKPDYEGCLSPLVLESFAKYMEGKTHLADGRTRESDNWQKGMPLDSYIKSLFRHFMAVWSIHRGWRENEKLTEELNAMLFNLQGYFHETLADLPDEETSPKES